MAIPTFACSSSGSGNGADGGAGDALPDALNIPPPSTETCSGDPSACISGTVATTGFKAKPITATVNLFHVYPYGAVTPVAAIPVAQDGTFAFSGVAAWGHYYAQVVARFGDSQKANGVASVVGPLSVPGATPLAMVVRPAFLEVLQQKPAGGTSTLAWASAHLYDPSSGAELTDGTVTFSNGTKQWPMPYGSNVAGSQSYFVQVEMNVPAATAFTITASDAALGSSPTTYNLVGEPAAFDGAVTSPMGAATVPANQPLAVTWLAQPASSYTVLELFTVQGTNNFTQKYISPAANPPDTVTETIPASDLSAAGQYLLNVAYSKATCPATADGCVYNNSTVPVTFNAQ